MGPFEPSQGEIVISEALMYFAHNKHSGGIGWANQKSPLE